MSSSAPAAAPTPEAVAHERIAAPGPVSWFRLRALLLVLAVAVPAWVLAFDPNAVVGRYVRIITPNQLRSFDSVRMTEGGTVDPASAPSLRFYGFTALTASVVAGIMALRAGRCREERLLAYFILFLALGVVRLGSLPVLYPMTTLAGSPGVVADWVRWVAWNSLYLTPWMLAAAAFLRFGMLFPRPLPAEALLYGAHPASENRRPEWFWSKTPLSRPAAAVLLLLAFWLLLRAFVPAAYQRPFGMMLGLASLLSVSNPLSLLASERRRTWAFRRTLLPGTTRPGGLELPGTAVWWIRCIAIAVIAAEIWGRSNTYVGGPFTGILGGVVVVVRWVRSSLAAEPRVIWLPPLVNTAAFALMDRSRLPIQIPDVFILVGMTVGARALWTNYFLVSAGERRRIRWIFVGLILAFGLALVAFPVQVLLAATVCRAGWRTVCSALYLMNIFPLLLLLPFIVLAVFWNGALDSALVLRTTAVYTGLGVVIICLFTLLERFIGSLVEPSLPEGVWPGAVACGLAVAVRPLHKISERTVDHVLDRWLPETSVADAPRSQAAVLALEILGVPADEPAMLTLGGALHRAARGAAIEHRGRLVLSASEQALLEFEEVVDAINACLDIGLATARAAEQSASGIQLRGGLAWGTVVHREEDELIGMPVTEANSLRVTATAGEIWLSPGAAERVPSPSKWEIVDGPARYALQPIDSSKAGPGTAMRFRWQRTEAPPLE